MTKYIDRFGIWVSSLCALHCLMLPVLLPAIPLLSASIFAQHWFERLILVVSLMVGFWALLSGFYRYHRQLYPIYGLAVGGLIYWNKDIFGAAYEPFTVTFGALLIVAAHVINLKLCQNCKDCQECADSY